MTEDPQNKQRNERVWEVTRGFEVVGTIEAHDEPAPTTYTARCRIEGDCWQSGPGESGSDLEEAADALAAHIHERHTAEAEQHLDTVLSVTRRTPEATAIRDQLRDASSGPKAPSGE